jgi:hypothetical protein
MEVYFFIFPIPGLKKPLRHRPDSLHIIRGEHNANPVQTKSIPVLFATKEHGRQLCLHHGKVIHLPDVDEQAPARRDRSDTRFLSMVRISVFNLFKYLVRAVAP